MSYSRSPNYNGKHTDFRLPSEPVSTPQVRTSFYAGVSGPGKPKTTPNPGVTGSEKKMGFLQKAFNIGGIAARVAGATILGAAGVGHGRQVESKMSSAKHSGSSPNHKPSAPHGTGMSVMASVLQSVGHAGIELGAHAVLEHTGPAVAVVGKAFLEVVGEVAANSLRNDENCCECEDMSCGVRGDGVRCDGECSNGRCEEGDVRTISLDVIENVYHACDTVCGESGLPGSSLS